jgi:hypothetical protein
MSLKHDNIETTKTKANHRQNKRHYHVDSAEGHGLVECSRFPLEWENRMNHFGCDVFFKPPIRDT